MVDGVAVAELLAEVVPTEPLEVAAVVGTAGVVPLV
jgi:hypothetical protein